MNQAVTHLELTADIVAAHVSNNHVAVSDVATLVSQVHQALLKLGLTMEEVPSPKKIPAVSARASVRPEYIVCMGCGKKQKTLKRHLQTAHQMTPEQYRAEYGLASNYPMVAPDYSKRRSEVACEFGLGRRKAPAKPARVRRVKTTG